MSSLLTLPIPTMVIQKKLPQTYSMDELSILEERIRGNIAETKIQMYITMLRVETDLLWPIIETLKWVLN